MVQHPLNISEVPGCISSTIWKQSPREEVTSGCDASWNSEKLLILGMRWRGSASVGEGRPHKVLGPSRSLQPYWLDNTHESPLRRFSRPLEIHTQTQRACALPCSAEILFLQHLPSAAMGRMLKPL